MGNIYMKPVRKASVEITPGNGLRLRMEYRSSEKLSDRLKADPRFGLEVYNTILKNGYASITDANNLSRSPSAGVLYVLENGDIFSHRRDIKAPTHKLWHSLQIGFPSCERQTRFPEEIMIAEGSETILTTRDKEPYIIVPKEDPVGRAITLDLANRIGVKTDKVVEAGFDYENGPDEIEIYDSGGVISRTNGYLNMLWEEETAVNLDKICRIDFDPYNIVPIDTEGMFKDGKYIHFNRETFRFSPQEIKDLRFGEKLSYPTVYKSEMTEQGRKAVAQHTEPENAPYVFMPDDNISRIMFPLGLWEGNWLEHFRDFHKKLVG